jgi:ribosomal protein S18 acetylase RimI-like enzyme
VIRQATTDDLALVRTLWDEFNAEVRDAPWRDPDEDEDFADVEKAIGEGGVLLADDAGVAVVRTVGSRAAELLFIHVRPAARHGGLASELVAEVVKTAKGRGLDVLELTVLDDNAEARAVYERWGFAPVEHVLAAPLDALERRLGQKADGPTFGFVHVQTDDVGAIERAVAKVLPRLGHSEASEVRQPANGWIAVRSDLTDRDPVQLKALAKELSFSSETVTLSIGVETGTVVRYNLFDRGSDVDEYLSVPEFYGPLPPGDAMALGANPTVVARLTGADAHRVREIARTASTPDALPPAQELYEQILATFGLQP